MTHCINNLAKCKRKTLKSYLHHSVMSSNSVCFVCVYLTTRSTVSRTVISATWCTSGYEWCRYWRMRPRVTVRNVALEALWLSLVRDAARYAARVWLITLITTVRPVSCPLHHVVRGSIITLITLDPLQRFKGRISCFMVLGGKEDFLMCQRYMQQIKIH